MQSEAFIVHMFSILKFLLKTCNCHLSDISMTSCAIASVVFYGTNETALRGDSKRIYTHE